MNSSIRRVVRSKDQARLSYNQMSRWYDIMSGSSKEKYRNIGLQKLNVREGERILELGFGTGHCILALDGVFMSFTLELFDTPEFPLVLNQCYAGLRPGGRLAVVSMVKKNNMAIKIYEWFHDKMPNMVDCR